MLWRSGACKTLQGACRWRSPDGDVSWVEWTTGRGIMGKCHDFRCLAGAAEFCRLFRDGLVRRAPCRNSPTWQLLWGKPLEGLTFRLVCGIVFVSSLTTPTRGYRPVFEPSQFRADRIIMTKLLKLVGIKTANAGDQCWICDEDNRLRVWRDGRCVRSRITC